MRYQELIPLLVNELQRHEFQQALQGQQQELAALRAMVEQLRRRAECGRPHRTWGPAEWEKRQEWLMYHSQSRTLPLECSTALRTPHLVLALKLL